MRSPLAFRPRAAPLQLASPAAAATYLGAFCLAAFLFSDPLLLSALIGAGVSAGYLAGVGAAVRFALKIGLVMAALLVAVNGLVSSSGATVLIRLGDWPLFGHVEVTAEALAAGVVIGLRAMAIMILTSVYSAAVDPDRVLRALRPWMRRSALSASLASRFLPLALEDAGRISEAARLRGPGATPVGRAEMARRLLAGSLDRAVEVAATLELRGYSLSSERQSAKRKPGPRPARSPSRAAAKSRFDRRFWMVGGAVGLVSILGRITGLGEFESYPSIDYLIVPTEALLAAGFVLAGLAPIRPRARSLRTVKKGPVAAPGGAAIGAGNV